MKVKDFQLKAKSYLPAGQAGKLKANKGFTFIEILIAVAIISALIGIVSMRVLDSKEDSEIVACWASIAQINAASEAYRMSNGGYTDNIDDLAGYFTLLPKCRVGENGPSYYLIPGEGMVGDNETYGSDDNFHQHGQTNYPFIDDIFVLKKQ